MKGYNTTQLPSEATFAQRLFIDEIATLNNISLAMTLLIEFATFRFAYAKRARRNDALLGRRSTSMTPCFVVEKCNRLSKLLSCQGANIVASKLDNNMDKYVILCCHSEVCVQAVGISSF